MPEPTNTSFIPKRNPIQKDNRPGRRKVYVGTIVIRILFFAAVVAAGSVYAYESKLNTNLGDEIFKLNNAISTFNETEMSRVLAFDNRLSEVNYRVAHAASVVSLLQAIENSTVDDVQITQLNIERQDDNNFTVEASLKTPSFDRALFQRKVLEETDTLLVTAISDLSLQNVPPEDPLFRSDKDLAEEVVVGFKAALKVDVDKIPYTVSTTNDPVLPSISDFEQVVDEEPVLNADVLEESTNPNEI